MVGCFCLFWVVFFILYLVPTFCHHDVCRIFFRPHSDPSLAAFSDEIRDLCGWFGAITAEAQALRRQKLEDLRADLARVEAHQGIAQLDLLDQKLSGLIEVLKRRLNAGELTQFRYLDAAEQVYLSAIDNLHEIYVALTSVGTIDREHIDRRLRELRTLGGKAATAISEIDSLSQRRTMLEQQTAKVETLFAQNEQAMTTLDHAATALADARINKGQASVDIDSALSELESLARRAGSYAKRTNP